MKNAIEKAHAAAREASQRTLEQAGRFAALHATAKPLFQQVMRRPGSPAVLVRVVWPGVLTVCDPKTGEVLAQSAAGCPYQLDEDFNPWKEACSAKQFLS